MLYLRPVPSWSGRNCVAFRNSWQRTTGWCLGVRLRSWAPRRYSRCPITHADWGVSGSRCSIARWLSGAHDDRHQTEADVRRCREASRCAWQRCHLQVRHDPARYRSGRHAGRIQPGGTPAGSARGLHDQGHRADPADARVPVTGRGGACARRATGCTAKARADQLRHRGGQRRIRGAIGLVARKREKVRHGVQHRHARHLAAGSASPGARQRRAQRRRDVTHAHDAGPNAYGRSFALAIALNVGFVVVEAIFGWRASSLALRADAGHNLTDVAGLVLAWAGMLAVGLRPNSQHTYGWQRASIVASFANALLLLVVMGTLIWEALHRLRTPVPIEGATVIIVAAVGVAVNGATAFLFMSGRKRDLNIRGAFLHMAADALVSLGVVAAGALYVRTQWQWLDPVTSLVVAALVV